MLRSNVQNSYYWYNDEYMYFTFNGVHSSKYHLFIQNTKELTIENTVGAASEYSNAMLQEGTYYLGTSRKQKTFKRKCAAQLSTMDEYKNMMKWLSTGATGELVFDSDQYWGWTVVLDTVGDATFVKRAGLIVVEFEITFKTIGTYLAHNIYPGTWIQPQPIYNASLIKIDEKWDIDSAYLDVIGSNNLHIPPVVAFAKYDSSQKEYIVDFYLQSINNIKQDFVLNFDLTGFTNHTIKTFQLMQIDKNQNTTVYLTSSFNSTLNSISYLKYSSKNSILYINNDLAELHPDCLTVSQPNGIIKINNESPEELYTTAISRVTNSSPIFITLDELSNEDFSYNNYDYVCVIKNSNDAPLYGTDEYADYDFTGDSFIAFVAPCETTQRIGEIDSTNLPYLTLTNFKSGTASKVDNTYKVYCGKTYHFQAKLTFEIKSGSITGVPFTIQVTSYNNL